MAWKRFNPWPAFADMTMMLFVVALGGAAAVVADHEKDRRELKKREQEIVKLKEQIPKRRAECGDATPFLGKLQSCMDTRGLAVTQENCKIRVGEDRIRFQTNSATIEKEFEDNAHTLAGCLIEAGAAISPGGERDDAARGGVEAIHIDGYTDCVGENLSNLSLGAKRAESLYKLILEKLDGASDPPLLRRLAVRSFGENRPKGSRSTPCPVTGIETDRRVTISVEQTVTQERDDGR